MNHFTTVEPARATPPRHAPEAAEGACAPRRPPGPDSARHGAHHVQRLRTDFLGFTRELYEQYGDCVYYRAAMTDVYQFTHPDQFQEVLVTHARSFRKTDRLRAVFRRWLGDGLLLSEGSLWSEQRHAVQPAFHPQTLPSYAPTIVRRAGELCDRELCYGELCGRSADATFDAGRTLLRLTTLTTADMLFGVDLSDVADRFADTVTTMQAAAYSAFTTPRRRTDAALDVRRGITFLRGVVDRIVEHAVQSPATHNHLVARLFAAAECDACGRPASDRLRDEIAMLLLAGSSTTATAITWAAYTLAAHPQVQDRARQEVDRVLGDRPPTAENVKSLAYLESTLLETLRLYPPAYMTSRQAVAAVEIGGYTLPAGAQVHLIPLWMHRDPRWFDEPLAFRPQRFAPDRRDAVPRFAFLPFGLGPRACIGGGLALLECMLVLATVLQRGRIELADGQQPPQLEPLISLHPKGGVRLKLCPRAG